jgi:hypothetical protein
MNSRPIEHLARDLARKAGGGFPDILKQVYLSSGTDLLEL